MKYAIPVIIAVILGAAFLDSFLINRKLDRLSDNLSLTRTSLERFETNSKSLYERLAVYPAEISTPEEKPRQIQKNPLEIIPVSEKIILSPPTTEKFIFIGGKTYEVHTGSKGGRYIWKERKDGTTYKQYIK